MNADPHRDPERLRDDLAAYALGALDRDDAAELERHLDGCESCMARLRWLDPAVGLLPAAVPQLTPPDSLRENLIATVRAEAAPVAPSASEPDRLGDRLRRWWRGLAGAVWRPATAFAVLILLVAGIATGYLVRGADESSSEFFPAKPAPGTTDVSATLERTGDAAILHVNSMPELDRRHVYEVWVQRAGVMEPRNTFVLKRDGSAEAAIPGPFEGANAVFVTAEPRPGTNKPTTTPLLSAPLG